MTALNINNCKRTCRVLYYVAVPHNADNISDPEYNTSDVLKVAVGNDLVVTV